MLGSIRLPEEAEVFGGQDWAEVHRLDRVGVPKRAIARRLHMSHTTVHRLLSLGEPPRYERGRTFSLVDPFAGEIASMLDQNPKAPATVVLQHVRRDGYTGGITILKEHLAKVRPSFLAARTFQRTSCQTSSSMVNLPIWGSASGSLRSAGSAGQAFCACFAAMNSLRQPANRLASTRSSRATTSRSSPRSRRITASV